MSDTVVFHLSRSLVIFGNYVDPYEAIRSGRKTVEYRPHNRFWRLHLIKANPQPSRAWFVVRYSKDNLPRLEADITKNVQRYLAKQIEVHFKNVVEVTGKTDGSNGEEGNKHA